MSELSLIDKLTLQLNQDWLKLNQIKGFEVDPEETDEYYIKRHRREAWMKIFYSVHGADLNADYDVDLRSKFERGELV